MKKLFSQYIVSMLSPPPTPPIYSPPTPTTHLHALYFCVEIQKAGKESQQTNKEGHNTNTQVNPQTTKQNHNIQAKKLRDKTKTTVK